MASGAPLLELADPSDLEVVVDVLTTEAVGIAPGAPVAIDNVADTGLEYYQTYGTFPANYLFWDDVHPTTQGHAIIAGLALQALPEPGTCALVAFGLGFVLLRRQRA